MIMATDVYENTSESLSAVMQHVLENDEIDQPAKLASLKQEILKDIKTTTIPINTFSDDQLQDLRNEVDALIEEYGDDALVEYFVKPRASQALTSLIEAGMDKLGTPSLQQLFNALEQGLITDLVAEGEIDDDEAQTVTAELQALIDKHGDEALAEDFVRYL